MEHLPSKKLITTVLALVVVGALVFVAGNKKFDWFDGGAGSVVFEQKFEDRAVDKIKDTDTDGDGLKDWEETLWGSDPLIFDTDEDGVGDGEEVKLKRSPVVAGPNDALNLSSGGSSGLVSGDTEPETFTETVSRDLFAKYLFLKEQGQFDSATQKELIQDIVSSASLAGVEKRVYVTPDLNIVGDNSQESLVAYGNALRGAFVQNATTEVGKELVIIQGSIEGGKQDEEELKKVVLASQSYEAIERASLGIKVPFDIASLHIKLVNSYAAMSAIDIELAEMFNDPMRALVGLREYNEEIEILLESITNIRFFLENRGIIFDDSTQKYVIKS